MRKFARSIGSEGKRHGQRGGQCLLSGGRFSVGVRRFGVVPAVGDRSVCMKATFLRQVLLSPHGTRSWLAAAKNCQLRTAYGGESNCVIKT